MEILEGINSKIVIELITLSPKEELMSMISAVTDIIKMASLEENNVKCATTMYFLMNLLDAMIEAIETTPK